jgi:hypothetical protein
MILNIDSKTLKTSALFIYITTMIYFIDKPVMRLHALYFSQLNEKYRFEVVAIYVVSLGDITYLTLAELNIYCHRENIYIFVTKFDYNTIGLSVPLLCHYDS